MYRICRPASTHSHLSQLACVSVECRCDRRTSFLNQAFSQTMNTVGAAASTGGCIYLLTISIVKPTRCTNVSNLFYFGNDTLHVSDGLSVHHQEFKTVHMPQCFFLFIFHCRYLHPYQYTYYSFPLVPQCKYLLKLVSGTIL